MPKEEIKFYYKNIMADIIGNEHGITQEQLKDLSEQTAPLIQQLNEERQEGNWGDLPSA